jgi:hypothetical protein
MNSEHKKPINPELLAEKFAAAARMEDVRLAEQLEKDPRLGELLRAIQWFSFQPGGLAKLAKDVLAAYSSRVFTKAMKMAGTPGRDGQWTLEQCLIAWEQAWKDDGFFRLRDRSSNRTLAMELLMSEDELDEKPPKVGCDFKHWLAFYFELTLTVDRITGGIDCDKASILRGLHQFNHAHFRDEAFKTAAERLPGYLYDLCTLQNLEIGEGPFWFPDVLAVLFDFMAEHDGKERLSVALTEVSRIIADTVDDIWESKGLGRITGRTGFGKTYNLESECRSRPGRFRRAEVPGGDSLSDLIRIIGESLGMEFPFGRLKPEHRQKVEFALRHLRLGIVLDEAHRLCPEKFNRDSIAERYNWIRSAIIDQGLPCVLSVTYQTNAGETTEQRESRFVKTTGFNMEQFTRRITNDVLLPKLLSQGDFVAVAKHYFGELNQTEIEYLVDAAMSSFGGIGVFRIVKLRAHRIAELRGAKEASFSDYQAAVDTVPRATAGFGSGAGEHSARTGKPAKPARQPRKPAAAAVQGFRPGIAANDFGASRMTNGGPEASLRAPVLASV